jgi:hypothetical protein
MRADSFDMVVLLELLYPLDGKPHILTILTLLPIMLKILGKHNNRALPPLDRRPPILRHHLNIPIRLDFSRL